MLLYLILISNRDKKSKNIISRYIYVNKLNDNLNNILEDLNIKYKTFYKKMNALEIMGIIYKEEKDFYEIICKDGILKNGFILLNENQIKEIINSQITNNSLRVLLSIIDILNKANKKELNITREEISNIVNMTYKTISKCLKELESKNLICLNQNRKNKNGKNSYIININF